MTPAGAGAVAVLALVCSSLLVMALLPHNNKSGRGHGGEFWCYGAVRREMPEKARVYQCYDG